MIIYSVLFIYCLELSGPFHNLKKSIWRDSHDCQFKATVWFTPVESISAYRRFIEIIIHLLLCAFSKVDITVGDFTNVLICTLGEMIGTERTPRAALSTTPAMHRMV